MASNSQPTTKYASVSAWCTFGIKNGSVCMTPPKNVMTPVIDPRIAGFPRPVREPSSDKPSEKAIEIPAPTAAASPTRKAVLPEVQRAAASGLGDRDYIALAMQSAKQP